MIVLSGRLQVLLDVESSCKAKIFQTMLLEVLCRFLGKPSGCGSMGQVGLGVLAEMEPWPKLTAGRDKCQKCSASLGSACIFCFGLHLRLHLKKGVWDFKRPNFFP